MVECFSCKKRKAFFSRSYAGEYLCRKCFLNSINKKVFVVIGKNKMLEVEDKIAVAVSGGKDSLSLLNILYEIELGFPKSSLFVITIDEGIAGYRDEALKIVNENCKKLDLEQVTVSFKKLYGYTMDEIVKRNKERKLSACAYCGILRRKALNIAARKVNANKIATGHTLDDEIQTFFLNIVHGSSFRLENSSSILNENTLGLVPRIKPLCEVLERESALYAYIKGINFQEIPCPYSGEALRNDIRKILNRLENNHPGMKYTILGSMKKITRGLKKKPGKKNKCKKCGEITTKNICQACQVVQNLIK
jgi:uncharacterized protein (TIGR00269 family)